MLSYSNSLSLYQQLTNNNESANTTLFNVLFNMYLRNIYSLHDFKFLEDSKDISLVSGTQFYNLPYNFKKLINLYQINSGTKYSIKKCPDRETWDKLSRTGTSSDIPEWYYIFKRQIGITPKPSSSSNTLTLVYKKRTKNLSAADYTTGTVAVTNDSKIVTGTSTNWTSSMNSRWFKVDSDGEYYQIDSVDSATQLTLKNKYEGSTASGENYTIIETSELPEDYQDIPVLLAVATYFKKERDLNTAQIFENEAKEKLITLRRRYGDLTEDFTIIDDDIEIIDPNLFITAT